MIARVHGLLMIAVTVKANDEASDNVLIYR